MSEERDISPFTPDQLKLLATSDHDLRRQTSTFCFDQPRFADRIRGGERWQQLLQAHLYYDHVITVMLTDALKNPDAINLKRMGFYQKSRLVMAMGLLLSWLI